MYFIQELLSMVKPGVYFSYSTTTEYLETVVHAQ